MHQQGGTIEEALNSISTHEYVLPAIQREFVWLPDQVCNLFDSVMQGYPFGEFMLWRVAPENSAQAGMTSREYHQRDNPHCLGYDLRQTIDGSTRWSGLTAFNIGLSGSMARKLPYKWWNSLDAFPKRVRTRCWHLLNPMKMVVVMYLIS